MAKAKGDFTMEKTTQLLRLALLAAATSLTLTSAGHDLSMTFGPGGIVRTDASPASGSG